MNSLAFKSNIYIVNERTYNKLPHEKLTSQGKEIDFPWGAHQIFTSNEGFTDHISSCSAGGITNKQKFTLFHLIPYLHVGENFKKVISNLTAKADIKKNGNESLNGLIIGGKYIHSENRDHDSDSRPLFDNLNKFFRKNKIPYSVLWGQTYSNHRKTHILYSAKGIPDICEKDSWVVYTSPEVKSVDDLKKAYKFISISTKDQLYINGEKIPREQLKKLDLTG